MDHIESLLTAIATAQAELENCQQISKQIPCSITTENSVVLNTAIENLTTKLQHLRATPLIKKAESHTAQRELSQAILNLINNILEADTFIEKYIKEDSFTITKPLIELKLPPEAIIEIKFDVTTEYHSDDEGGYTYGYTIPDLFGHTITWDTDVLIALLSNYIDLDSFPYDDEPPEVALVDTFNDALSNVYPEWQYEFEYEVNLEKLMNGQKNATFQIPIAALHASMNNHTPIDSNTP